MRRGQSLEQLEDRTLLSNASLIDINEDSIGSQPDDFVQVGDDLFFNAQDGIHGTELWKTDGTLDGTVLVKDINPGPSPSFSSQVFERLEVGGTLFFVADDGVTGLELWKSDGTEAGTVLVKDINPSGSSSVGHMTDHNGTLYFRANDGIHGRELWKSDGTEAGTVLVKDINSDGDGLHPQSRIVSFGTFLLFAADDGATGSELWRSDGTETGTVLVADLSAGSLSGTTGRRLTASGSFVFFSGVDPAGGGIELLRTDGTPTGTRLVRDINPTRSSGPDNLTDVDGTLFFTAETDVGYELWKSDGSEEGTVLVKDINPNGHSLRFAQGFVPVGDKLLFVPDDGTHGEELWISDGTEAGTRLVRDINPGAVGAGVGIVPGMVDGITYLRANDGTTGSELWKTDGTEAGTVLVKDIDATSVTNNGSGVGGLNGSAAFGLLNDRLLFAANDGVVGMELWTSDGTDSGTELVKNIDVISTENAYPRLSNAYIDGDLVFSTSISSINAPVNESDGLWRTDGTREGTTKITDVEATDMFEADGTIFFTSRYDELWVSDGTEPGTRLLKEVRPGTGQAFPLGFTKLDGSVFFTADDGTHGRELWKTNGTTAGTVMVTDLNPGGNGGAGGGGLAELNGDLFFPGTDGNTGVELWKTDGTGAGTVLVKDISPGNGHTNLQGFQVVGDTLFFIADGPEGRERWKSDGTTEGTTVLKDINPGSGDSAGSQEMVVVNETFYFSANDGTNGVQLWKSDGTEAGTHMVTDINSDAGGSLPYILGAVDDTLLFGLDTDLTGRELWKTTGTAASTTLVKDILPGVESGIDRRVQAGTFNNEVYFVANDGVSDYELWKSDGTEAGTVLVDDIFEGNAGSYPQQFRNVGDEFVFVAGGAHGFAGSHTFPVNYAGFELYRLTDDPVELTATKSDALSVDNDNDGKVDPGDTIQYTVTLTVGPQTDADLLSFTDTVDANTDIVPGSVTTTQGTITQGSNGGPTVSVNIGTIAATESVTIQYSVLVDPVTTANQVLSQGTISGDNFDDVLTDDPDTAAEADATITSVENDGSVQLDFGDAPDAIRFDGSNYVDQLVLNGDAAFVSNGQDVLRLTPAENSAAGSAYLKDPFVITDGGSLITKIDFRMDGFALGEDGGDGFAVVLQNSADGASALRSNGRGHTLGLDDVENSVAVAFHTAFDDNHIKIFTNGNIDRGQELASVEVDQPLNNGTTLFTWITYDGTTDLLQVFLSDTNGDTPPAVPVLTHTIDIAGILGDQAYAGLSSATGGLNDNHDILAWTFGGFSYETFLANDGARHVIGGPYLGDTPPDAEINGQTDTSALGDDAVGIDDDDSILSFTDFVDGRAASVEFLVGGAPDGAFIDAWADFNGNRMFDPEEHLTDGDSFAVVNGSNTLNFTVPEGSFEATGGTTFVRARISSAGNLEPGGLANDGEVEDNLIEIMNGDEPVLTISDGSLVEGNNGEQLMEFIVSRSHNIGTPSVPWLTGDDTAVAGEDYVESSGTVEFEDGGDLEQIILIPILGDPVVELDETFFVKLGDAICAFVDDHEGLGTIENDDAATIRINNVTRDEGDDGETIFSFQISISAEVDEIINFTASTDADSGSATPGTDYQPLTNEPLMIRSPEMDAVLEVTVNGDTFGESDETFFVDLAGLDASGRDVTFADDRGKGTIRNDDGDDGPAPTCDSQHGVYLAGTTLMIIGRNSADTITVKPVGDEISATLNGEESRFAATSVTSMLICGSGGNDRITQSVASPTARIEGGPGRDRLTGGAGKDTLLGGGGDDTLIGNGGNDLLRGGGERDVLRGGDGDDRLIGNNDRDNIAGGDGNDIIDGGNGADTLLGDDGDDVIRAGNGLNHVRGHEGDDDITGGRHRDSIWGDAGNDTIRGAGASDKLEGDSGADRIIGGSGRDTIGGGSGDDFLTGNKGDDNISGHAGADILIGGEENDVLGGNSGSDILIGSTGSDRIDGNSGSDIVIGSSVTLKEASLMYVRDEWTRSAQRTRRVANIRDGSGDDSGANKSRYLAIAGDHTTVIDDTSNDTLRGGAGIDWFFVANDDSLRDQRGFEELDRL